MKSQITLDNGTVATVIGGTKGHYLSQYAVERHPGPIMKHGVYDSEGGRRGLIWNEIVDGEIRSVLEYEAPDGREVTVHMGAGTWSLHYLAMTLLNDALTLLDQCRKVDGVDLKLRAAHLTRQLDGAVHSLVARDYAHSTWLSDGFSDTYSLVNAVTELATQLQVTMQDLIELEETEGE